MKNTWFISDLHLDPSRPLIIQQFLELLHALEGEAASLYILGDLFEYWIGDDILNTPEGAPFGPIVQSIQQLSSTGTQIYFTHGNRDFLIGDSFAERTGCTLLPEQQIIRLNGVPTLIMHGDTLCTDDIEYQQARKLMHSPQWQSEILQLSIPERIQKALELRMQSQQTTQSQREEILDANQQTIEKVMREEGVRQLIHGHTHRPGVHEFALDGQAATRIVLGDWYDQSSYLKVTSDDYLLSYAGRTETIVID